MARRRATSRSPTRSPMRPAAARPTAVAPKPAPTQVSQPAMAQQQPGLMANIASTAAGVAIGHTMGHAITGALGMNGRQEAAPVEAQQQGQLNQQQNPYTQGGNQPCKFELDEFLACTQAHSNDLSLCSGFNEVLKECKIRSGQMYQ